MPPQTNEDDDNEKTLEEKQQELLALGMAGEDEEEDAVISIGDDDEASDTDADKDKEKEKKAEGEDAEQKEDQRASSEAEEDAAEEERRKKERESSAQRRARQRRARELLEKKLAYYEKRNEELEKRFSNVELRQMQTERLTIDQAIKQAEAQLAEAKRLEKEAITAHDGDAAVQARELADIFEARRDALARRKLQVEQTARRRQEAPTMREPPPEMAAALMWIEANKSWFDPKLNNEDSILASAIEDALVREGKLSPSTPAFWEELDNRLARRGIGKRNNSAGIEDIDDDEEDEDNDASSDGAASRANSKSAGERADARNIKKPSGGPKVSVGGAKRVLKPGEVYVSADRVRAMKEAGIWDDPEARKQMLKRYREFDRQAAQGR